MTNQLTLDEILEQLHAESALGGIVNDGKPHPIRSHANGDSCVTEAKQQLTQLIAEIIGKDSATTSTTIMVRNMLKQEQRRRAKERGIDLAL